jgi:serine/threonine protein kinase
VGCREEVLRAFGLRGNGQSPTTSFRQLLRATAALERRGIVHGDLSDNNVIVDAASGALCLIDFDAFVAADAPDDIQRLSLGDGGAIGTPDYMPVDLQKCRNAGEDDVSPYSDRQSSGSVDVGDGHIVVDFVVSLTWLDSHVCDVPTEVD